MNGQFSLHYFPGFTISVSDRQPKQNQYANKAWRITDDASPIKSL